MPTVSNELVTLLNYLLPGFLAAWLFFGLTAHPKPTPFERVVQALVFNLVIQPFVILTGIILTWIGSHAAIGTWTVYSESVTSAFYAFVVGLLFAGMANSDVAHRWFRERNWRWTKREPSDRWVWTLRTSYPSEWYSALSRRDTQYLVLHLKGGRRLYGWADEWPDQPDKGHFVVSEAEWLLDENETQQLIGVQSILIPAVNVEMIEFMKPSIPDDTDSNEHFERAMEE